MEVFNQFLEENFEKSRHLALAMASMGPFAEGDAGEYIAFLKESYKHRLHSLLWNNRERMAAYAASTRCVSVCVHVCLSVCMCARACTTHCSISSGT